MLEQFLAAALLVGTAAALSAQSNISFEMNSDRSVSGSTVASGDFNNDGKPDLVECCNANQLEFLAGNGDGTFQAAITAGSAPNGLAYQGLVAADFNGDGKMDVAGADDQNSQLDVWYGNGDGTFQAPLTYALTNSPGSIAMGNFFGDGHWDIAVGEMNGNIDFFRNEGSAFTLAKSINLGTNTGGWVMLDAGDLNGNGVSDLAVALAYGASPAPVYALWNDGKGDFTPAELGTYTQPFVRVSRLNGDGMLDIIVGYTCNPTPNSSPRGSGYDPCAGFDVYYGQGNNNLFKRTVITDPDETGVGTYEALDVRGADVNGDGYGDIVVSTGTSCWCAFGVFVYPGNADGSFQQTPQVFIGSTDSAGPMTTSDFNRDGMMDFAVQGISDGNGQLYLNSTSRAACGTYTISPSVTACQPVDNTYSPSPVRVQANSFDTTPVTAMQEYIDYNLVYSQPVTSFDTTFSEGLGSHLLVTKAWDSSGRSFVANRTVTVYNGTPGPVCPAAPGGAAICLPSGTSSSSPVQILANGDSGINVPTAAQLYINGSLVVNDQGYCNANGGCTGGTSYVDTTQNLSTGTYDLVFKLWDASGAVHQAEKTITVQ